MNMSEKLLSKTKDKKNHISIENVLKNFMGNKYKISFETQEDINKQQCNNKQSKTEPVKNFEKINSNKLQKVNPSVEKDKNSYQKTATDPQRQKVVEFTDKDNYLNKNNFNSSLQNKPTEFYKKDVQTYQNDMQQSDYYLNEKNHFVSVDNQLKNQNNCYYFDPYEYQNSCYTHFDGNYEYNTDTNSKNDCFQPDNHSNNVNYFYDGFDKQNTVNYNQYNPNSHDYYTEPYDYQVNQNNQNQTQYNYDSGQNDYNCANNNNTQQNLSTYADVPAQNTYQPGHDSKFVNGYVQEGFYNQGKGNSYNWKDSSQHKNSETQEFLNNEAYARVDDFENVYDKAYGLKVNYHTNHFNPDIQYQEFKNHAYVELKNNDGSQSNEYQNFACNIDSTKPETIPLG